MGANWSEDVAQATYRDELHLVLRYCSWRDRLNVFSLNKAHRALYYGMENWIWMCELLRTQELLYIQKDPEISWQQTFMDHFNLLNRWHGIVEEDMFQMKVCARFRPLGSLKDKEHSHEENGNDSDDGGDSDDDAGDDDENNGRAVIPLHQRIRMIQAYHKCSASEARKRLWIGSNKGATYDPWKSAYVSDNQQTTKKKPLGARNATEEGSTCDQNGEEHDAVTHVKGDKKSVTSHSTAHVSGDSTTREDDADTGDVNTAEDGKIQGSEEDQVDGEETSDGSGDQIPDSSLPTTVRMGVLAVRPPTHDLVICAQGGLRRFVFNSVLDDSSKQEHLYDAAASGPVHQFLNGLNGCIVCYGQTGSGKTFSMFGPDEHASTSLSQMSPHAGLAPRIIREVAQIVERWRSYGLDASLHISCVEIYGQDVTDLLHNQSVVGAWHGLAARTVLNMECAEEVATCSQVEDLLCRVERSKKRATTAMNERSSRAHTVIMLSLKRRHPLLNRTIISSLSLADLGGSEQIKKSKAEGQRKLEAVQINLGLLALKRCIAARQHSNEGAHVPYGDSTLTSLLRPALEGNSMTTVVVTGRLEAPHTFETLQTMRFGEACQNVTGGVMTANVNNTTDAIEAVNQELEELSERIKREERWVNKVTVREDVDGKETVITSVLEGAEELRQRYEELLQTKNELLGI